MLLDKNGQKFEYEGITYKIGDEFIATDYSIYEGLKGTISEIRDGEDKETENEEPDIYCSFEISAGTKEYERFVELYGDSYSNMTSDVLIMAPSMIKTVSQMEKELNTLKEFIEKQGWWVSVCSFGDGSCSWDIGQHSPAGEDFSFDVVVDGDAETVVREIRDYYVSFDVDEHAELWIEGRGKRGVPASISVLIQDAKDIEKMLEELADNVEAWFEEPKSKSIDDIVFDATQVADAVERSAQQVNEKNNKEID